MTLRLLDESKSPTPDGRDSTDAVLDGTPLSIGRALAMMFGMFAIPYALLWIIGKLIQ